MVPLKKRLRRARCLQGHRSHLPGFIINTSLATTC